MGKPLLLFLGIIIFCYSSFSQISADQHWTDSVFNSLTDDQRIAQLMILRVSEKTANGVLYYEQQVGEAVKKYNIGAVLLFQGGPVRQARTVNYLQGLAQTPLMVCIDAEWGLGMRFDSIIPLNHQLMLGAVQDASIVYRYGQLVGRQLKRAGIQVNYAPVVDINNNPDNPVINDRSFGENKYKVALYGVQYMKGLQDVGVLATAKHFPGHGDVAVDSHVDLPVIHKSMEQLDSLELYPFKEMFKEGVGSVMIAHLYIPAIDSAPNRATSISRNNVTALLRDKLGYQGLSFTDALDMQGVAKFFPGGEIAVQSLIAGNDMLCLPHDVSETILKVKQAISGGMLRWEDIYSKCRKVLAVKFKYGIAGVKPVDTTNITNDLNKDVNGMKRLVAENAITLLSRQDNHFYPLPANKKNNDPAIAYVAMGISSDNAFAKRMRKDYKADVFYFNYKQDSASMLSTLELIRKRYNSIVVGVHNYARFPANNFGISRAAISLVQQLQQDAACIVFVFGNPYATRYFCGSKNLVACYEDDEITQDAAIDFLEGRITSKGKLPVTVCDQFRFGSGIISGRSLPTADPPDVGFDAVKLNLVDSIIADAIEKKAMPGAVVLVAKGGKIAYQKAFGHFDYDSAEHVTTETIYDLASVTKICATTLAVMKLVDEKKIDLKKKLGEYLPRLRNTDKAGLLIENILLHQAGLAAWIPFYKETIDISGMPVPSLYSSFRKDSFSIRVAENLFLRTAWRDTMYQRMVKSMLGPEDKYVYSDNDFIFLGQIVEAVSGLSLDEYVRQNFYEPMGLSSIGFRPRERFTLDRIAPTESEKQFRLQHLRGDVHDPGAAMFGGVAGHAGLFGNAFDLAAILEMLLEGGKFKGRRYLEEGTIDLFTAYNSSISRRGLGFDKPEKDHATSLDPYPSKSASPLTFGHTGFTGTCVWVDPKYSLIYIFLSNRVNPDGENDKLLRMGVRGKIQEAVYNAIL
ncbi:MAG: glycoside hydrolase family 3 N-terminal domain-containing protein [Ginsengibacter sp.]